ncbi:MAG: hypothetical protein AAGE01_00165 [Pseudomonadota bacterium]
MRYFAMMLCLLASAAVAQDLNEPTGAVSKDVTPGSIPSSTGQVLCSAAMNSDGTVGGGLSVDTGRTQRLDVGIYEVIFRGFSCRDIRASRGYYRWLQVDTLTTSFEDPAICTTADRADRINGVYVACFDLNGNPVDTSFFLFVGK